MGKAHGRSRSKSITSLHQELICVPLCDFGSDATVLLYYCTTLFGMPLAPMPACLSVRPAARSSLRYEFGTLFSLRAIPVTLEKTRLSFVLAFPFGVLMLRLTMLAFIVYFFAKKVFVKSTKFQFPTRIAHL